MKNNLLVYILLCLLNLSWANARNKQQEAEALIKKSVESEAGQLLCCQGN